jgi:hypothetical protein
VDCQPTFQKEHPRINAPRRNSKRQGRRIEQSMAIKLEVVDQEQDLPRISKSSRRQPQKSGLVPTQRNSKGKVVKILSYNSVKTFNIHFVKLGSTSREHP